jgi:hypothetical protein
MPWVTQESAVYIPAKLTFNREVQVLKDQFTHRGVMFSDVVKQPTLTG